MNYGQLKASIASWLKRGDLVADIPNFVQLAEARIARDFKLRQQIKRADITLTRAVREAPLPDDWLSFDSVVIIGGNKIPLDFAPIEYIEGKYPLDYYGLPLVYSVQGSNIITGPIPDAPYVLDVTYHAKYPALVDDVDTNWLLSTYPSIYLFAALAEAAPFLMDDERSVLWEGKYGKDKTELEKADDYARFSGSVLRVRALN